MTFVQKIERCIEQLDALEEWADDYAWGNPLSENFDQALSHVRQARSSLRQAIDYAREMRSLPRS